MIDTKSRLVLAILAKEAKNGNYKLFETADIIMSMPRHYRIDTEAVKHILTHLERQDIISIKYDDDDTYCIAVLPYGFEILESETRKTTYKSNKKSFPTALFCFLSSLFGAILGVLICYLVIK